MSSLSKALLVVAAFGLAACEGGFGNSAQDSGAGSASGPGAIADPTSPAYFQQEVGDRVLFPVDQSNLTPAAEATLTGQARWLAANPDYVVTIEGHADEQGTRQYNLALGERRANAAREFLISQGVASNRIQVVSFGKERPLEICSNESCYGQNRRAVTVLAGGLTG